jgi:hypothetical protein
MTNAVFPKTRIAACILLDFCSALPASAQAPSLTGTAYITS